jgi:hypothetical protein
MFAYYLRMLEVSRNIWSDRQYPLPARPKNVPASSLPPSQRIHFGIYTVFLSSAQTLGLWTEGIWKGTILSTNSQAGTKPPKNQAGARIDLFSCGPINQLAILQIYWRTLVYVESFIFRCRTRSQPEILPRHSG